MTDAPRAATQEEEIQVTPAQLYSAIMEIKASQQEFRIETQNSLAALSERMASIESILTTP